MNWKAENKTSLIPLFSWILFSAAFLLVIYAAFWSYFGTIPITIKGKGIFVSQSGLLNVQTKIDGTISQIFVTPGTVVKKGDTLIEIRDSQTELQYQEAQIRVDTLTRQIEKLKEEIELEAAAEQKALLIRIKAAEYSIVQIIDVIDFLNREIVKRKELVKEGLISDSLLIAADQNITLKKIELEEKITLLASLNARLNKEYRTEEMRTKEHQLLTDQHQRDLLKVAIDLGKITSPQDGKVLEILVNPGDEVHIGKALVWMESLVDPDEKEYVVYGFFPVEMGKRINLGMFVDLEVSTVNFKKYGYLKGKVEEVSPFAVTKDNIRSKIQNSVLVDYLTDQSTAVVQVLVKPEKNPELPDAYVWSSGKQPPIELSTGTVAKISATVEKVRPIYYLIPLPQLKYH